MLVKCIKVHKKHDKEAMPEELIVSQATTWVGEFYKQSPSPDWRALPWGYNQGAKCRRILGQAHYSEKPGGGKRIFSLGLSDRKQRVLEMSLVVIRGVATKSLDAMWRNLMLFVKVLREFGVIQGARQIVFRFPNAPTLCKREACSPCLYSWAPASLKAALGLLPSLEMRQLHLDCAVQDLGSDFIGTMISGVCAHFS